MNSPRRMAQLHARALAIVAVVHHGGVDLELPVYEHMLLLSLVEAFEDGCRNRVISVIRALPDWLGVLLERAYDAGEIENVVRDVRHRAVEIGAQIGGVA